MQVSGLNNSFMNFQIYNNMVEKSQPEVVIQNTVQENLYHDRETYNLPPFYVYDKYSGFRKKYSKYNWSSEKILEMTELALNKFSELICNNDYSITSVNQILTDILPYELANSIEFKDFDTDFINKNNISENYKAYVTEDIQGKTLIYIPIKDITKSDYDRVMCKNYFAHELKHALTANTTDTEQNLLEQIASNKTAQKYSNIFKEIEQTYDFRFENNLEKLHQIDLTQDNFIKNIINTQTKQSFRCYEELIEDFENELIFSLNNFDFSKNILNSRIFCEFMAHYSLDEKEAYIFQKVLRELNNDTSKPVKIELRLLKYEFFENYFKSKVDNLI